MDSSIIADRRRLRRKLGFWRLIAVALIVALGFAFYHFALGDAGTERPHIAHVTISGLIVDDDELLERLKKVETSDQVKAAVISISSPGGTTYGGEKSSRRSVRYQPRSLSSPTCAHLPPPPVT